MQTVTFSKLKTLFPDNFYQGLSMFGALSEECRDFLLQQGTLWHALPGDTLFRVGDNSGLFYIVLSGTVRFFQSKEEGGEMVALRSYEVGQQIGFVGMIGLHQRRGEAVMEEEGYLLQVSSELFHRLCEQYPQMFQIFLINITREMSREISHLDQMYVRK